MRSLEDMEQVIAFAQEYVQRQFPGASREHVNAFVNAVVYACYRVTGPFGGPSVREHAAGRILNDVVVPLEDASLETMCAFVAPVVLGPLTVIHVHIWETLRSICFNDDPSDIATLDKIIANGSSRQGTQSLTTKMPAATLKKFRTIAALQDEQLQKSFDRLASNELTRLGMLPRPHSAREQLTEDE